MTTQKDRKKKSNKTPRKDTKRTESLSFRDSRWWTWSVRCLIAVLVLIFLGAGILVGGYLYFAQGLPDYRSLSDYQPPQITRILARDGSLIGEMYEDRRTLVPRENIPDVLVQAILSAEDAAFYEHEGLDYLGMLRAFYNAVRAGRVKGGGSTITQQTVKNLLLTPEKSLERKARELILARRLESHLSKDDILTIYMNAIYFGHKRYGVQEACRFYFGKDVSKINLNQAATLAGLIQSPERHSPMKHPESAKNRRKYVLKQMVNNGYISESIAQSTVEKPLELRTEPIGLNPDNMHFVDEVKRQLIEEYGEKRIKTSGYTVRTTLDPFRQSKAVSALRQGLRELDKRQGFGQVIRKVKSGKIETWKATRSKELKGKPPSFGSKATGIVIDIEPQRFVLHLGVGTAHLSRRLTERLGDRADTPIFKRGDVIRIQMANDGNPHPKPRKALLRGLPEGALLVLNNDSREVLAMVGGYTYRSSTFNRSLQARRQPGSAFKPFVWGAAFDTRKFTPASVFIDGPETLRQYRGKYWRPKNYSKHFKGEISLRKALASSVNSVAIQLADQVSVPKVHEFARALGITSTLSPGLAVALGGSEVTAMEIINAYATIADQGLPKAPQFILSVDGYDEPAWQPHQAQYSGINPDVAYVLRHVMRSVITVGSGKSLRKVDREIIGKTGTTNRSRDAWFVGSVSDVAFGAWVGFDAGQALGGKESGGRTAVPIIKTYIESAEMDGPTWLPAPEGVVTRRIVQPDRLAHRESKKGYEEVFLSGTEPVEYAVADGELDRMDFHFERDEAEPPTPQPETTETDLSEQDEKIDLSPIPAADDTEDDTEDIEDTEDAIDLSPIDPLEAEKPTETQANVILEKPLSGGEPADGPSADIGDEDEDRPDPVSTPVDSIPTDDEDHPDQ